MGEFADDLIDKMFDEYDSWEEDEGPFPTTKTCRHCGQGGFSWLFVEGAGWRLANQQGVHACPKFKKKPVARVLRPEKKIPIREHGYEW